MLDPFVALHRVPENDNTNIEAIVGWLAALAHRCQIAIDIDHHIRKPNTNSSGDTSVADARCPGCVGEPPPYAPPGYVYYPAYGQQLPGPNCYWFRMPVYDAYGNMVSWRGPPVGFCSWLAGFRPAYPL